MESFRNRRGLATIKRSEPRLSGYRCEWMKRSDQWTEIECIDSMWSSERERGAEFREKKKKKKKKKNRIEFNRGETLEEEERGK